MVPPFVQVGERLHLVVDWDPEGPSPATLRLRPLSPDQQRQVRSAIDHALFEAWAVLVPSPPS